MKPSHLPFQGPVNGRLHIVPMPLIHFLSFGEVFLFVLLDFAFSLQLCLPTN